MAASARDVRGARRDAARAPLPPGLSDLSPSVATVAAAYVTICWRDRCSHSVDPRDELGLCAPCRDDLRSMSQGA